MGVKLKNNAVGYLSTAISASDVGISLQSGNGSVFPSLNAGDYFYATIASAAGTYEVVKVTARIGDALTIARAQEGTTANSFASGSRIELRVTAQGIIDALAQLALQSNYYTFTGTGSQTAFILTSQPYDVYSVFVIVNGLVLKYSDDYTISETTLTFTTAPALNDEIVARWLYIRDAATTEYDADFILLE